MAHYPDPDSARAGDGAGPFYTHNQPVMNAQTALDLTAQLVREVVPETNHIITPGQDGNSHLEPKFTRPISSSQNYPPPHLGQMSAPGQQFTTESSNGEGSENRKKSKVSRACDECRRKKIRCDADSENNNAPKCSNCTRTQAECKFSRVPMKRGPSKGYIKELADRLDHVEKNLVRAPEFQGSAMSPNHMSPQMPDGYARTDNFIRKRTHSESEGQSQHAYLQSQLQSAAENYPFNYGQESPAQPFSQPYAHIQAQQQAQQQAPTADMSYRPTMQGYHHAAANGAIVNGQPGQLVQPNLDRLPDTISPWKDRLIDEYYQKIHPTFPLLANDKNELRALLTHALTPLRDAFFEALYMVARSSAITPTIQHPAPQEHYEKIAMRGESADCASRSNLANLVYLQTSVLMVIAIDTSGPPRCQPPNLPERALWFGRAWTAAQYLKLPANEVVNTIPGGGIDTVHAQNRRAWWTLVVVEKWHAVGTATYSQIPDGCANLADDDRQLLGDQLFDLARHSRFLVHISTTFMRAPTTTPAQLQIMASLLTSFLEAYRESVLPLSNRALIHLILKHAALLHARNLTSPFAESPRDIPTLAVTFASLIFEYQPALLGMHFLALAAKTLIQLAEIREVRLLALEGLNTLKQTGEKMGPLRPGSWEAVIFDIIKVKIAEAEGIDGAGLRSLADAAVGGVEGEGANTSAVLEDWSALTREGYLNVW